MAKRGGKTVKGVNASIDSPLPTLDSPNATKHQTMIEWAKEGRSDAEIAMGVFDVHHDTFYAWTNGERPSDPGFLEAYKRAKTIAKGWFNQVIRGGFEDSHETYDAEGNLKSKATRANAGLIQFYGRNLFGYRVSDPKDDGDDKKEKSTMIYDGQLPDVLGNASN